MPPRINRDQYEAQARRTLLWCGLFLVLGTILGGMLVDRCPMRIRFPEAAKTIAAWRQAKAANVLILGSSRLESFIHHEDLTRTAQQASGQPDISCFKATVPGGEPITLEFLTRHLLAARESPPRLVLIETNADLLARDNLYFRGIITRQLTFSDLASCLVDIVRYHDGTPRLLSSRVTPFYRHRYHFLKWLETITGPEMKQPQEEPARIAHGPIVGLDIGDLEQPKVQAAPPEERLRYALNHFQAHLRHYQLPGATSRAFEKMVATLHDQGCHVVLLEPPLISSHRLFYDNNVRSPFGEFVQKLCRSYGCEFFDYSDKLPDSLFVDNHHGSGEGGRVFTEMVAQEVVAPAWRNLQARASK